MHLLAESNSARVLRELAVLLRIVVVERRLGHGFYVLFRLFSVGMSERNPVNNQVLFSRLHVPLCLNRSFSCLIVRYY